MTTVLGSAKVVTDEPEIGTGLLEAARVYRPHYYSPASLFSVPIYISRDLFSSNSKSLILFLKRVFFSSLKSKKQYSNFGNQEKLDQKMADGR